MDRQTEYSTMRFSYIESMNMLGSKATAARLGYSHKWFKHWLRQNIPNIKRRK